MALKGFWSVRSRGSNFWQIFHITHSSCLFEPWGYAQGTREGSFARTRNSTQYTVHFTTFRVPSTVLRYGGVEFWCSLLADLSIGVQTAARAPICPLLCRCSQVTRRKVSLADGQGRKERRTQVNRPEQALILENLLKKNGACVWSETNAKILIRSWFVCK